MFCAIRVYFQPPSTFCKPPVIITTAIRTFSCAVVFFISESILFSICVFFAPAFIDGQFSTTWLSADFRYCYRQLCGILLNMPNNIMCFYFMQKKPLTSNRGNVVTICTKEIVKQLPNYVNPKKKKTPDFGVRGFRLTFWKCRVNLCCRKN